MIDLPTSLPERAPKPRLFVEADLAAAVEISMPAAANHYLGQVMRKRPGDRLAVFNGRDGEWAAEIVTLARSAGRIRLERCLRPQRPEPGPALWFAPLKRARLELLVEKAVELGAAALQPVVTRRSVVERVKPERLAAIAIEAAEQCGRLTVPAIAPPLKLPAALAARTPAATLYVGDETGGGRPLLAALAEHGPGDLLVGPEGGFAPEELVELSAAAGVVLVDLGPRILRAETAALVALAGWQLTFGRPADP